MWLRLKQVALVARDLAPFVDDLRAVLGLEVAFRDPLVRQFGLANVVLPIGHHFLEVISPIEPGTAAGRLLDRRDGDGGYMVITHCADETFAARQAERLGLRTAFSFSTDDGFDCRQLHPADTGGTFLEIDHQAGADDPFGPWHPAGPAWPRSIRTHVVTGITGVEVQIGDDAVARRWAQALDRELTVADVPEITLDDGRIRFVPADRRGDGLAAIELAAADTAQVLATAARRGLATDAHSFVLCGTRFVVSAEPYHRAER